jgi:hypothetical protein
MLNQITLTSYYLAPDGRVTVERRSIIDQKNYCLTLYCSRQQLVEGMTNYERGSLLQDAFPTLPAPQREFIKSGITPDEWINMFGPPPVTV